MPRGNVSLLAKYCCFLLIFSYSFHTAASNIDWSENLYLNGFFTLDLSLTDKDLAAPGSSGAMRFFEQDELNFKNSLIGGQLEYQFTDNLSLFTQGVAFYDREDEITTDINWAYLSYDLAYDITVRAGQFQTPFLQGTELRTVGYSRLWARPLAPGTGASGINEYQGVDLIKHMSLGEYHLTFQLAVGNADHELDEVEVDNMELISTRIQREQFWLRAALMHAQYSVSTPRGQLIIDDGDVLMASIETEVVVNQVVINAGFSTSNSDVTPDDTMHYLSLGYQFDEITPYLMFGKQGQSFEAYTLPPRENNPGTSNGSSIIKPGNGLPPPQGTSPSTPDGDANAYMLAIGARWNVRENIALKFQLENIRTTDNTKRPNSRGDTDGNIVTFAIEGAF